MVSKRPRCKAPHLWPNERALHLAARDECRLSRELGTPLYRVAFGSQKRRPSTLTLWSARQGHGDGGRPEKIHAVAVREDGAVYYSARGLERSTSATWLLKSLPSREKQFARMALLLTPSQLVRMSPPEPETVRAAQQVQVEIAEPGLHKNDHGIDACDGLSEIGLDAALAMQLLQPTAVSEMPSGVRLYGAVQFRGMFFAPASEETVLAKGMLVVNVKLGARLVLSDSCVKARAPGRLPEHRDFAYGMDVVRSTDKPYGSPCLTPSFAAVLRLRIAAVPDVAERKALLTAYKEAMAEACSWTEAVVPRTAWGLATEAVAPPGVRDLAPRVAPTAAPVDAWLPGAGLRTLVSKIDIRCGAVGAAEPETDVALLAVEREEFLPHLAARGTREALLRGKTRFCSSATSICKRPRSYIPAAAFTLTAVSDPRNKLPAGSCYVIVDGKAMIGSAAVWRMPCHSVSDVEVMEAVDPPATGLLPDNTLVLSRRGLVNTRLAGGDLDGDIDHVTFWPALVDLVRRTTEAAAAMGMGEVDVGLAERLQRTETPVDADAERISSAAGRAAGFVAFSMGVEAVTVRGRVCAMSERAAHKALTSKDALGDGTLAAACRFAALCHKAMDVPKHYGAKAVWDLSEELRSDKDTGFAPRALRGPAQLSGDLCPKSFARVTRQRAFNVAVDLGVLPSQSLGAVWCGADRLVLGEEAGRRIMERMLAMPRGIPVHERTVLRSPLVELAALFRHKLRSVTKQPHGDGPEDLCLLGSRPAHVLEAALTDSRMTQIKAWRSLLDSGLP
jgi:hypothetical protein